MDSLITHNKVGTNNPSFQDSCVTVDGLGIRYRRWGEEGRPVVLVHGLASTRRIWDLVAPLIARNSHVLALDQRGHGDTHKPTGGYDFQTIATDLNGFLDALDIQHPVLVGHSWGGNVVVQHAVSYPEVAAGLCLIDGGTIEISSMNGMTLPVARKKLAPPDFAGMTTGQLTALIQERDFGYEITPEIESIILANFESLPNGTVRARFPRSNHMLVIDSMWIHKPSELFSSVRCPVLIMPTRSNRIEKPSEWQAATEIQTIGASQLLAKSETVWLEDSVHDVVLQRPSLVAHLINEWIQSVSLGLVKE